jgi:hypothetical protein
MTQKKLLFIFYSLLCLGCSHPKLAASSSSNNMQLCAIDLNDQVKHYLGQMIRSADKIYVYDMYTVHNYSSDETAYTISELPYYKQRLNAQKPLVVCKYLDRYIFIYADTGDLFKIDSMFYYVKELAHSSLDGKYRKWIVYENRNNTYRLDTIGKLPFAISTPVKFPPNSYDDVAGNKKRRRQ